MWRSNKKTATKAIFLEIITKSSLNCPSKIAIDRPWQYVQTFKMATKAVAKLCILAQPREWLVFIDKRYSSSSFNAGQFVYLQFFCKVWLQFAELYVVKICIIPKKSIFQWMTACLQINTMKNDRQNQLVIQFTTYCQFNPFSALESLTATMYFSPVVLACCYLEMSTQL